MSKVIGVVPARWASTRFPGKPLALIAGKPLLRRVYEQCLKAQKLDHVLIATDDQKIRVAAESWGAEVVMTSPKHPTGSDRLAEVAKNLKCDVVVNIQGDEPLIKPSMIDSLIQSLLDDKTVVVSTLARKIVEAADLDNPNVVKVVFDQNNRALYFSRFCIPFEREKKADHFKHFGIYAYRRLFLLKFVQMKPSRIEEIEKLEQLRVLENGYGIKVVLTQSDSIGVDVPEDITRVEQVLRKTKLKK